MRLLKTKNIIGFARTGSLFVRQGRGFAARAVRARRFEYSIGGGGGWGKWFVFFLIQSVNEGENVTEAARSLHWLRRFRHCLRASRAGPRSRTARQTSDLRDVRSTIHMNMDYQYNIILLLVVVERKQ